MIIRNNELLRDKDKLMQKYSKKIELAFVQRLVTEPDLINGAIILKNEVYKVFRFCTEIIDESQRTKKKLTQIVDYIADTYNVKVSKDYLNFLSAILLNSFNKAVYDISDVDTFVDFI